MQLCYVIVATEVDQLERFDIIDNWIFRAMVALCPRPLAAAGDLVLTIDVVILISLVRLLC
jgi:hypothetical protein